MSINFWGLVKASTFGDCCITEYFVFHANFRYSPPWRQCVCFQLNVLDCFVYFFHVFNWQAMSRCTRDDLLERIREDFGDKKDIFDHKVSYKSLFMQKASGFAVMAIQSLWQWQVGDQYTRKTLRSQYIQRNKQQIFSGKSLLGKEE